MNKLKESISNESSKSGNRDSSNKSSDAINPTTNATISPASVTRRFSDTYIYGVTAVAVLGIYFVNFLHITRDLLRIWIRNKSTKIR